MKWGLLQTNIHQLIRHTLYKSVHVYVYIESASMYCFDWLDASEISMWILGSFALWRPLKAYNVTSPILRHRMETEKAVWSCDVDSVSRYRTPETETLKSYVLNCLQKLSPDLSGLAGRPKTRQTGGPTEENRKVQQDMDTPPKYISSSEIRIGRVLGIGSTLQLHLSNT